MSRVALSRVLNDGAAISPEMALRIAAWLGVNRGREARLWLAEQSADDVWQAQQRFKVVPIPVHPAPPTARRIQALRRSGLAAKRPNRVLEQPAGLTTTHYQRGEPWRPPLSGE